tara:strand:+ start:7838 stop:9016 length:1179 start_codon:yes stop_codon:yes gene_type:complete
MKRNIVLLFTCLIFFNLKAQNIENGIGQNDLNTITTAVPFLLIGPDSRSGAMGDVGVATSADSYSLHWNPSKLIFAEGDLGMSVSYVPWLRALVPDINLSYIGGFKKLNKNEAIGVELRYFSLGDITFTNTEGDVVGQYKPNEFAIGSAYSRKLSDLFSLAISGRYIYSNLTGGQYAGSIATKAGQAIAADVSGFYSKPISIAKKDIDFSLGLNISNIGSKIAYSETSTRDFIPINLRFGSSISSDLDDYNKLSLALDINKLLVPTPPRYNSDGDIIEGQDPDVAVVSGIFQSFGDAPGGFKEEMREINYSVGSEYWYNDQFAIRAGYFFEHNTKGGRKFFTFGSGLKYSVFILDFSYLVNASRAINGTNPLANTMRFSMTWNFGDPKASVN